MKILSIETSCDETAISIVDASGGQTRPVFRVLAHTIASQIAIHKEWGGVVPNIAKREHAKSLIPLLTKAMDQAFGSSKFKIQSSKIKPEDQKIKKIKNILERESNLGLDFLALIPELAKPKIDAIAVTYGPGLEPALWVGINFARALSLWWDLPLIPVNHMEGHLLSSLASEEKAQSSKSKVQKNTKIQFPAVALLASGGHTEIVLVKDWLKYKVIGRTRDDAVGEAFDKVARLLGLPYPGGPEISRLAEKFELRHQVSKFNVEVGPPKRRSGSSIYKLPRPMINSGDFDFSFSGLKTAVLYLVKKIEPLSDNDKIAIAHEFQNAALDVLLAKSFAAMEKFQAKTLIVGGGVIANRLLQARLSNESSAKFPAARLLLPSRELSTDNATMIGIAAYFRSLKKTFRVNPKIKAEGNLSL